jgi:uncharacterized membrane protein
VLKLKKISFKSRIVVTINSLVILASALLMPPTANAATVAKLGSKCTKLNEVQLVKSEILMCMTSTKGWTWQSMGSTSTTPTKTAQTLPLVLNMTRKEAAQIKTYIACLHTNGLPNIKTLADIWNIDLTNTLSKQTLDACQSIRPKIADKPANKYIPAQESSTKKEIKVIVIGNNPRVEVGNNFQCNTGLGNFSIKWGITAKPLYPAFIASMDGTAQSLAYFKATSIDSSTIKLDNLTNLAVGKYLTCIVADPPGSTYLGSASVLIPKTN